MALPASSATRSAVELTTAEPVNVMDPPASSTTGPVLCTAPSMVMSTSAPSCTSVPAVTAATVKLCPAGALRYTPCNAIARIQPPRLLPTSSGLTAVPMEPPDAFSSRVLPSTLRSSLP